MIGTGYINLLQENSMRTTFLNIFFSGFLEPKMNPMYYRYALDDKPLLPIFCVGVEHVRTPHIYCSISNGICFDDKKNIMNLKRGHFTWERLSEN